MKKSTFVKEVKIWMKRNGFKRKAIYIHDGGNLFLHWRLQSKIDGHFIDCELLDENTLKVIWDEMGNTNEMIINYYWDYTLEQLYNIWMEA